MTPVRWKRQKERKIIIFIFGYALWYVLYGGERKTKTKITSQVRHIRVCASVYCTHRSHYKQAADCPHIDQRLYRVVWVNYRNYGRRAGVRPTKTLATNTNNNKKCTRHHTHIHIRIKPLYIFRMCTILNCRFLVCAVSFVIHLRACCLLFFSVLFFFQQLKKQK